MQQSKECVSSLHSGFELWSVYATANFYVYNVLSILGLPVQVSDSFLKKADGNKSNRQACRICSKAKNVCRVCILHLNYGQFMLLLIFMYVCDNAFTIAGLSVLV